MHHSEVGRYTVVSAGTEGRGGKPRSSQSSYLIHLAFLFAIYCDVTLFYGL